MTRKVYTCSWMAITHWFVLYAATITTHMTNMHYTNNHSSNSSNSSNSVPGRGQRRAQPRGCAVCLDARCRYAMALQSAVWLPVVRCCCHSTAAPLLHVSVAMTRLLLDHPLVHSTTTQTLMSGSSWQSVGRKWSLCSFDLLYAIIECQLFNQTATARASCLASHHGDCHVSVVCCGA